MANKKLLTAGQALDALKEGKTLYRQCWTSSRIRLVPKHGDLEAFIGVKLWNGNFTSWIPTQEDLTNDDWLIEE